jgi:superfamily II DNA or RNA helicase
MTTSGYIYIRTNSFYDIYNACKLGSTKYIPERDSTYCTGELNRGIFILVFQIIENKMIEIDDNFIFNKTNKVNKTNKILFIERILHQKLKDHNILYNAGTEFYDKIIINLIEPILNELSNSMDFIIEKLTDEEIDKLVRINRVKQTFAKINKRNLIKTILEVYSNKYSKIGLIKYTQREYQTIIINKAYEYFLYNNYGLLVLICGVGKTLISLWIAQKLQATSIIIGVPNILLLKQWKKVVKVLFKDVPCFILSGGKSESDITYFIRQNPLNNIIITTYSSSYKIYRVSKSIDYRFDFKINDETHHLTSFNLNDNSEKQFIRMLDIPCKKQLSLTATMKVLDDNNNRNINCTVSGTVSNNTVSNDNTELFGIVIDRKCLYWAIQNNILCDYIVQTIICEADQLEEHFTKFNIVLDNDKRLFLSSYTTLKSIQEGYSHHLLIYSNNKNNSNKIIEYINILLDNEYFYIPELYFNDYHSDKSVEEQINILKCFDKNKNGIISCVYCLGEGWDFPKLDGVVFSENMTSNVRIVQSGLRPSRKNSDEPNKISKIILPVLDNGNWLSDINNNDLKKVKEVIYQMGLEDESIIQKIKVYRINPSKDPVKKKKGTLDEPNGVFDEYDEELIQHLRLISTKRTTLGTTYEKARRIISEKNIISKEEYYELCIIDNRLPIEPEIFFKGQFTNWIEYLSIERIYYDLDTCKIKINKYIKVHPEWKEHYLNLNYICASLCELDNLFPPNGLWVEYYGIDSLESLIKFNILKKKSGVIV